MQEEMGGGHWGPVDRLHHQLSATGEEQRETGPQGHPSAATHGGREVSWGLSVLI